MNTVDLKANPLDTESFAGYGKFLDSSLVPPDAEESDFAFYYNLIEADFHDPVAISIVESKLQEDLYGNSLEMHFETPEVLIPLDGTIYLVLAKSDPSNTRKPDLKSARAFVVKPGQAVLLPSGIWHRAPLSTGSPVKTCCLVRKGTPQDNVLYYLKESYDMRFRVIC